MIWKLTFNEWKKMNEKEKKKPARDPPNAVSLVGFSSL